MEINVSSIIEATKEQPTRFSASIAETGDQSIGRKTWRNSCDQSIFKLTSYQDAAWREYLPEYGAWSEDDIEQMSVEESTALLVQFVSGDYRQLEELAQDAGYDADSLTDSQYEEITESAGGNIYKGDDGSWYYYVGI